MSHIEQVTIHLDGRGAGEGWWLEAIVEMVLVDAGYVGDRWGPPEPPTWEAIAVYVSDEAGHQFLIQDGLEWLEAMKVDLQELERRSTAQFGSTWQTRAAPMFCSGLHW